MPGTGIAGRHGTTARLSAIPRHRSVKMARQARRRRAPRRHTCRANGEGRGAGQHARAEYCRARRSDATAAHHRRRGPRGRGTRRRQLVCLAARFRRPARGRRQQCCGAAIRQFKRRSWPDLFFRWHVSRDARRAGARSSPAGDRTGVVGRLSRWQGRRDRHRAHARSRVPARWQRAPGRQEIPDRGRTD